MILDLGSPVSLVGIEWINQYLKDHGLEVKDLKNSECYQIFRFGPSKKYVSKIMVELPVIVRRLDGKEDIYISGGCGCTIFMWKERNGRKMEFKDRYKE